MTDLLRRNLRLLPLNILFAVGALVWAGCAASAEPAVPPVYTPPVYTPTTPSATTATVDNFAIDLLVNSSKCYGSAGGLLTVEVNVDTDMNDPGNGRLIYQIDGDDDGPITDSIEFVGRSYRTNTHVISTTACGTTPTIRITEVR